MQAGVEEKRKRGRSRRESHRLGRTFGTQFAPLEFSSGNWSHFRIFGLRKKFVVLAPLVYLLRISFLPPDLVSLLMASGFAANTANAPVLKSKNKPRSFRSRAREYAEVCLSPLDPPCSSADSYPLAGQRPSRCRLLEL